jgi:hypothetical protein
VKKKNYMFAEFLREAVSCKKKEEGEKEIG